MNKVEESLHKIFKDERVVFWFDDREKMREQFEGVELDGIEKIEVTNNEFAVKHKILSGGDSYKALLYFPKGEKPMRENWLLDLQLAHKIFHTDQEAMILQELELDYSLKELVSSHIEFFQSKERRAKLKELLAEDDKERDIQYKMMAVLFGTNYPTLEAFIQSYAEAYTNGSDKIEKALERYNLKDQFWRDVARKFNYQTESPSIYDFLLDAFGRNFRLTAGGKSARESRILLSLWKDAISYQDSFRTLSDKIADDLRVESKLDESGYEELLEEDIFRKIDYKIIHDLINQLTHESIAVDKLQAVIKKRENKYWYFEFRSLYACINHAAMMIDLIRRKGRINFGSIEEGAVSYARELSQIDYHYRKFIYHFRKANNSILTGLNEKASKVYSNDWLLQGNDNWQKTIDATEKWPVDSRHGQFRFFKTYVKPFVEKSQKLFVVISDALRYENGWELYRDIQGEQRYDGEMDYLITGIPSYTQLGMAALLPHEQLNVDPKDCSVLIDGISSKGTTARTKILQERSGVRATAINAEDFMKMNSHGQGRAFAKENDLIYIYHNSIDKVGDDKSSEVEVFEAVEKEIFFLKELLKKIANVNGNNILITADHGYIYQHEVLDESDFAESKVKGDIWKENRRFVLGASGLSGGSATKSFSGVDVGLTSDVEVLLAKSINRFRIKGAGSKFVHGGSSLQEIVVPLLKVSRKREDTTRQVDVELIKSTDKITTNNLAVSFIQKELVSAKVLPRQLRAYIKAEDEVQLSDMFSYTFNIAEGTERQRAVTHVFQMSAIASGNYKNQRVSLVLEEPVRGSAKWKEYETYTYVLNISFMNDFDI